MKKYFSLFCASIASFFLFACHPASAPVLGEMKATAPQKTHYTKSLLDLNTILEVYLPPSYHTTFYYVKPIRDSTGLAGTGEIPFNITTMVRDAVSQVYYKIRYVEQYDLSDLTHQQVLAQMQATNKLEDLTYSIRPPADFTISGAISQYDRNLSSRSQDFDVMASFGGGTGRTDIAGSSSSSQRRSRLGVSFNITNLDGISVPGKYGAVSELYFAKNSKDLGFSILGNGIGYAAQATAMHGRHLALQMLCELSVVQIIGRTLNIPYWRVGGVGNIFDEDRLVIRAWRNEYKNILSQGLIIPYTQALLIANGIPVAITGKMNKETHDAINEFKERHKIFAPFPDFKIHKALEVNRLLNIQVAHFAWDAYHMFKEPGSHLH